MFEEILKKGEKGAAKALSALGFSDGKRAFKNLTLLSASPLVEDAEDIEGLGKLALASPSPDQALTNLERLVENTPRNILSRFLEERENLTRLIIICGSSPYLSGILAQSAEFFEGLFPGGALYEKKDLAVFKTELIDRTKGVKENTAADFDAFGKALRLYKKREYLRIGARDLLGLAGMEEVTAELSDLAEASLEAAYEFCLEELKASYGSPVYTDENGKEHGAGFSVMGLGKLGGRELNFSSDIDIIYIYTTERGETEGIEGKKDSRLPLHAFFVKLSERITRLVSRVTDEGFVFRVDLELRPGGKSGELANSLRSSEIYYESFGQTWERSAMIKARCVAGSRELGERFLEMIRPFVYRRSMDFTAIEEIKSMKEKIDLVLLRRNPETVDVKLGRGGIREIEFFCQALQLIHGGKNPEVRERNTLKSIKRLNKKKLLGDDEARDLAAGYVFLRNLEHRIQIVEGRQTQAVPARPEELERLARMMGFKDTEEKAAGEHFWDEYKKKTGRVYDIYRSLFYTPREGLLEEVPEEVLFLFSPDTGGERALHGLRGLGFRDAETAFKKLELLREGPHLDYLPSRARVLFERITPFLLAKVVASPDPDMALGHVESFISAIGRRTSLYSMLSENPRLMEELAKIFGTSQFLSRRLIEHPESLDMLLSAELTRPRKKKGEMRGELEKIMSSAKDYEERLDELRRFRNLEIFRIGTNDIIGELSYEEVSIQITALAEASLEAAYEMALGELIKKYGKPGAAFAVVGLGKLGGGELGYGSDLDIIFVYDVGGREETTGPRIISNHEFFVLLAQRIISILTVRTKEGLVFKVDARLRPSGSAGPLVVSRAAFLSYHREKAAIWERQSALKARFAAGNEKFGHEIIHELEGAVYLKPPAKEDIKELLRIRKRMEVEIAKETPARFNIKTGRGGLVDIEFLVQTLQLDHGSGDHGNRSLRTPHTMKALGALHGSRVISDADYFTLKRAYGFYRAVETRLRIVHDKPEGVLNRDNTEELDRLARRMGYTGDNAGEALLGEYLYHADRVRGIYLKHLR
jgi:glutamate-ammonia-ligase adenylyltransferase